MLTNTRLFSNVAFNGELRDQKQSTTRDFLRSLPTESSKAVGQGIALIKGAVTEENIIPPGHVISYETSGHDLVLNHRIPGRGHGGISSKRINCFELTPALIISVIKNWVANTVTYYKGDWENATTYYKGERFNEPQEAKNGAAEATMKVIYGDQYVPPQ